jgi:hypothetical protein
MSQQQPPPSRAQRVADAFARADREAHLELEPEAQPSPEEVEQQRP